MRIPVRWLCAGAALCLLASGARGAERSKYVEAVRQFADNILEHGRDVYGERHTPLLVDGLNVDTLEPVKWKSTSGREWVLSNLGNQQVLFRTLEGLSAITGDVKYRNLAMEATRYAYQHLNYGGLLYWGGHAAYDATGDRGVFSEDRGKSHELKEHFPYYELMWKADAERTKLLIESIWSGHVLDWAILDFNRHGTPKAPGLLWSHEYKGGPVFFWGKGLTFLNAGADLYYAAAVLSKLTGDQQPLTWAKRLAHRYVETRNPKTGIGGFQFSQTNAWCDDKGLIRGDRAQYQYGEFFPGKLVVEGTLFPCYGDAPGVNPQLCQMALGRMLGAEGTEFSKWAVEELLAWAKSAYRASDNTFIPMLTDGTSMEGFVVQKDGYFGPKGRVIRAGKARAQHFWAYAEATNHSSDPKLWEMARLIAKGNGFGDIGANENSAPALELKTSSAETAALFGFLTLHRRTGQGAYLDMARRIGDNILAQRFSRGYFLPSSKHLFARFDRAEPLALLHLAAALEGKPDAVPPFFGSGAFFAAAYADRGHQYDTSFIYGQTRR